MFLSQYILIISDEYFLSNLKIIDNVTHERKQRILKTINWSPRTIQSLEIWPSYNMQTTHQSDNNELNCTGCGHKGVTTRISLCGQPYNIDTLQSVPPDRVSLLEKV